MGISMANAGGGGLQQGGGRLRFTRGKRPRSGGSGVRALFFPPGIFPRGQPSTDGRIFVRVQWANFISLGSQLHGSNSPYWRESLLEQQVQMQWDPGKGSVFCLGNTTYCRYADYNWEASHIATKDHQFYLRFRPSRLQCYYIFHAYQLVQSLQQLQKQYMSGNCT